MEGTDCDCQAVACGGGAAMTTPNRPPLWEAMADAFDKAAPAASFCGAEILARCKAAEIRALRDWLVPEEPPPHRGMRPGGTNLTHRETLSVERQRLRALLTAEADRAERGEVMADAFDKAAPAASFCGTEMLARCNDRSKQSTHHDDTHQKHR